MANKKTAKLAAGCFVAFLLFALGYQYKWVASYVFATSFVLLLPGMYWMTTRHVARLCRQPWGERNEQ